MSALFNAFLWGSWAVFLKKLDSYPLDAFFLGIYIFSFAFVWILAWIVLGKELFEELARGLARAARDHHRRPGGRRDHLSSAFGSP